MPNYTIADSEAHAVLKQAMTTYHLRLAESDVTVALLAAFSEEDENGEPKGPALRLHGVPALAIVRVMPLKMRAHGLADVEIVIDGDKWTLLSFNEKLAVIDHELTHIELHFRDNILLRDDLGRPRLKMRPHDYEFGWFKEVAERHGECSQERQQAARMVDAAGQFFFEFATR